MFDLNYYNTLCLIAKYVEFKYEGAKGWGMYKRAYCHNLDNTSKGEIRAEYVDTQTQIKLWGSRYAITQGYVYIYIYFVFLSIKL